MAMQKAQSYKGIQLDDAVIRVRKVVADWEASALFVFGRIYANATETEPIDELSFMRPFVYTPYTGDVIEFGYNLLKQLPEFSGAIDV